MFGSCQIVWSRRGRDYTVPFPPNQRDELREQNFVWLLPGTVSGWQALNPGE
jgi:hypothetical protein